MATARRMRLYRLAGTILALALASAPAAAAAKVRVAVPQFTGPKGAAAQKAVVKVLKQDGYLIVPAAAWKKALKRAGADGDEALAKTARKTRAAAVVIGKLEKQGRKQVLLTLSVYRGGGGLVETVDVALRAGKVDPRARRTIVSDLLPAVARSGEARPDGPAVAKGAEVSPPRPVAMRGTVADKDQATMVATAVTATTVAPAPPPAPLAPPPPVRRAAQTVDEEKPRR